MVRIKSNIATQKRKKKTLKEARGQFGHRSTRYKQAVKSLIKGMVYAFRDRKVKKREFRSLWIIRINAACKEAGISYSRFINGLNNAGVEINRKVISDLAIESPDAFKQLVKLAQETPSQKTAK